MASQRHLRIINPAHRGSRSFPSFELLPTELRLDIWQLSLQRPRFINIELSPKKHCGEQLQEEQSPYGTHNSLGKVVSGTHYCITANGSQLLSKLLRVSSEARQAALGFYRVHLACHFELGDRQGHGTLFLNPEYDILHIQPGRDIYHFADFIHDLRAHDPLDVGLLNLALDHNCIANLPNIDFSNLLASQAAFADTLANLRQVYFLCLENAGRIYLGPRGGIHTVTGFEFHRSRPIMSTIPTFDRVARDPRDGMDRDLSRVFVGTFDPRQMPCRWHLLLGAWQIRHPHQGPEYRFLVANGWGSGRMAKKAKNISDRDSAAEWLQQEEERWIAGQERHAASILRRGGKLPVESPEELERVPRPAIGFWLFPIEALGPIPGSDALLNPHDNGSSWESKRVVDMRHHWPELCLASMA
ncbi:hypothetical protein NUW58_g2675 [Xylaria curta]|uniref:Uncharacterized protein n=1 Tax=Xylaria curta TaxID=42375 RepID=A0ACC1PEG5_9PEZI|nr:hypothetical protein NUW58_g2675 [Xylaria curta]